MINLTPAAVKAVQRFIRGSETPVAGLRVSAIALLHLHQDIADRILARFFELDDRTARDTRDEFLF